MLLRHVVACRGIALFAYDVASNTMVARGAAGPAAARLRRLRCRMGQGPVGWTAVNRRVVVNGASGLQADAADGAGLIWTLAVPLVSGDHLAGVLAFYSAVPFVDDQARVVELLAPHLVAGLTAVDVRHESAAPVENLPAARVLELRSERAS
jgi:hypothetical protein